MEHRRGAMPSGSASTTAWTGSSPMRSGPGDDALQDGRRLRDVRQRRAAGGAHAGRPRPGPLGHHDLPPRRPPVPGVRAADARPGRGAAPSSSERRQVIDPITAYQITSMLEGVVQRGTAPGHGAPRRPDRRQDRHHERRARRLVRGLHLEHRGGLLHRLRPAPLPRPAAPSAARSARPVFQAFMQKAVAKYGGGPFEVPPGGQFIKIDRHHRRAPAGRRERARTWWPSTSARARSPSSASCTTAASRSVRTCR